MKDSDEKKDNDRNDKKDKIIEKKTDGNLDHISESPTVEEPESNSKLADEEPKIYKGYSDHIRFGLGKSKASYAGTTATIDNLVYQPLRGSAYYGQSYFHQKAGKSFAEKISPLVGKTVASIYGTAFSTVASPTIDDQFKLQNEISELRAKYSEKLKEVHSLKEDSKEAEEKLKEVHSLKEDSKEAEEKLKEAEKDRQELLKRENLNHLIARVNEEARQKLSLCF